MHKNSHQIVKTKSADLIHHSDPVNKNLCYYANKYFCLFVENSSPHTERAKKADINSFLSYYLETLGSDEPKLWTPSITRGFQKALSEKTSKKTKTKYAATTINRTMATIRHFGRWLHKEVKLPWGNPCQGLKSIQVEESAWNGIPQKIITRLKAACEMRMNACKRQNQNPLLESVVFYLLLTTGIRESELAALNVGQYHSRGLHNVVRKGSKITKKIPVPSETRELLDKYLETRENLTPTLPLLTTRYNGRISTRDIARICGRISQQASAHLFDEEKIFLAPHMLRHTFLKQIADKHGVHTAQELSGNISIREIFRYTRPSAQEKEKIVEELY